MGSPASDNLFNGVGNWCAKQGDKLCLDVTLAEVGVMKESIVLMMRSVLMSYSAIVRLCIKFLNTPTIVLNMTMKMTMMM
eukprot:13225789-Ditylum_brightwellii.AAC.1